MNILFKLVINSLGRTLIKKTKSCYQRGKKILKARKLPYKVADS